MVYEFYLIRESDFIIHLQHHPNTTDVLDINEFVLCGHVHEKWLWLGNNFNVGVDCHNFAPISIDTVKDHLKRWNNDNSK